MKIGDLLAHLRSLGLPAIGTFYLTFVGRDSTCISAMTRGQFRIRGQTQSMSDFGSIGRTVAYWVELVLLGFKAHCAIVEPSHPTNPVCSFGKNLPHYKLQHSSTVTLSSGLKGHGERPHYCSSEEVSRTPYLLALFRRCPTSRRGERWLNQRYPTIEQLPSSPKWSKSNIRWSLFTVGTIQFSSVVDTLDLTSNRRSFLQIPLCLNGTRLSMIRVWPGRRCCAFRSFSKRSQGGPLPH